MGYYKWDCPMMECDLSWVAVSKPSPSTPLQPTITIKILIGKQKLTAFLDSSSFMLMIRSYLLPTGLPVLGWAHIFCLHHHTQRMLIIWAQLHYAGQCHNLNLVQNEDLPWPLLLGRDTPEFAALLRQATSEGDIWALEEDPEERTS